MRPDPDAAGAPVEAGARLRRLARRLCDAHRGLDDGSLLALVSGSTVDGTADERSDVDMTIVFAELPAPAELQAACTRAGATPWFWTGGQWEEQAVVVAFRIDGTEVQIGYSTHAALADQIDELLLRHNPDTPLHKLGEGLLKAEPLYGHARLQALQQRLAAFPDGLALAMARHFAATAVPWKAMAQIVHRDAPLWCRELQVQAAYRLLGLLAAVNRRYYTTFQNKRLHRLAASYDRAPAAFADRLEQLLQLPPTAAAEALFALEGEVLQIVGEAFPGLDLEALQRARQGFVTSR